MFVQERLYKITTSRNGDILVGIKTRTTEPQNARVIYDGGDHALFYRSADDVVLLDYLTDEFKEHAPTNKTVYITENDANDMVERIYTVPLMKVKKMPGAEQMPESFEEIEKRLEQAAQDGNLDEVGTEIAEKYGLFDEEA